LPGVTFILGAGAAAIYFATRILKPTDPAQFWTFVGSIGTCAGTVITAAGVLVAAFSFQSTTQQSRLSLGADMLLKLDDRFNAQGMREARARAAQKLKAQPQKTDGDVDRILDFFEGVALLERRGAIDTELVWHTFYHWLFHYYHLTKSYRTLVRESDPSVWADLEQLYIRIMSLQDRMRRAAVTRPTSSELASFVAEEVALSDQRQ